MNFSTGNAKLKKTAKVLLKLTGKKHKVVSFNLPAPLACPSAGACRAICYAQQGRYGFESAQRPRTANMQAIDTLLESGVPSLVSELSKHIAILDRTKSKLVVRIHDSGDFYRADYVRAWIQVARAFPGVVFYAYTKSIDIVPDFLLSNDIPNFVMCASLGGKHDKRAVKLAESDPGVILSRIFPVEPTGPTGQVLSEDTEHAHATREREGYLDGNSELGDCTLILRQSNRIGLVYHGTRKLTPAQVKAIA